MISPTTEVRCLILKRFKQFYWLKLIECDSLAFIELVHSTATKDL